MNGNVGIGTWAPISVLQVNGNLTVGAAGSQFVANSSGYISTLQGQAVQISDNAVLVNINGTAIYGNKDNNSTNNTTYQGGGNANSFVTIEPSGATGNGDYIDFKEGNVGLGTVDVMRMANGNVGIGSVSPGQTLDVQGTVRDSGEIVNGNVGVGTALTTTSALTVMSGNVGIGTWVPGAIMSIPSLKANSGTRYLCIDTNGNVLSSAIACSGT
jgi:hypothetical protein